VIRHPAQQRTEWHLKGVSLYFVAAATVAHSYFLREHSGRKCFTTELLNILKLYRACMGPLPLRGEVMRGNNRAQAPAQQCACASHLETSSLLLVSYHKYV